MKMGTSDYHRFLQRKGQPANRFLWPISRPGFGKTELIVCIAVVLVLGSLALLTISRQNQLARRNLCEQRQTSLAVAFRLYALIENEYPGWRQPAKMPQENKTVGWPIAVLPWLGRPLEPEERDGSLPVDRTRKGPRAKDAEELETVPAGRFLSDFICAADLRLAETINPRPAWLSYVANTGQPDREMFAEEETPDLLANGVLLDYSRDKQRSSPTYVSEHDGEELTLLLSENLDARNWTADEEAVVGFVWTEPPGLAINELLGKGDGSLRFARPAGHRGGVNVVFCGENTQFLSEKTDLVVLRALMTSDHEQAK